MIIGCFAEYVEFFGLLSHGGFMAVWAVARELGIAIFCITLEVLHREIQVHSRKSGSTAGVAYWLI